MSHVSLTDIQTKLRQVQDELDDASATAKPAGLALGSSVFAGVIGAAYLLGKRRARRQTTIVEVRRV